MYDNFRWRVDREMYGPLAYSNSWRYDRCSAKNGVTPLARCMHPSVHLNLTARRFCMTKFGGAWIARCSLYYMMAGAIM